MVIILYLIFSVICAVEIIWFYFHCSVFTECILPLFIELLFGDGCLYIWNGLIYLINVYKLVFIYLKVGLNIKD